MATDRISQRIANWALSYDATTMSTDVISKAHDCILDNLAAALAGYCFLPASAARHIATTTFGEGNARIWFGPSRMVSPGVV